jgi:hypothetical protein
MSSALGWSRGPMSSGGPNPYAGTEMGLMSEVPSERVVSVVAGPALAAGAETVAAPKRKILSDADITKIEKSADRIMKELGVIFKYVQEEKFQIECEMLPFIVISLNSRVSMLERDKLSLVSDFNALEGNGKTEIPAPLREKIATFKAESRLTIRKIEFILKRPDVDKIFRDTETGLGSLLERMDRMISRIDEEDADPEFLRDALSGNVQALSIVTEDYRALPKEAKKALPLTERISVDRKKQEFHEKVRQFGTAFLRKFPGVSLERPSF